MKFWTLFLFIGFLSFAYSQDSSCGQLPFAKVDEKAVLKTDLQNVIESNEEHLAPFYKEGEFEGVFKLFVDCKGAVYQIMYSSGNLENEHQDHLKKIIQETEWQPAVNADKNVNATVFMTITIKKHQVAVTMK